MQLNPTINILDNRIDILYDSPLLELDFEILILGIFSIHNVQVLQLYNVLVSDNRIP